MTDIIPQQSDQAVAPQAAFSIINVAQIMIIIALSLLMYRQFFKGYTYMGVAKKKSSGLPISKILPAKAAAIEERRAKEKMTYEERARGIATQAGVGVSFSYLDEDYYTGIAWYDVNGTHVKARDLAELKFKMKAAGLVGAIK